MTETPPRKNLQIDVISDVICPWCFIGKRKIDTALEAFAATNADFDINISWRPYQLDPSAPAEGRDYRESIEAKFGPGGLEMLANKINAAADGTGIDFAFDKIKRSPNTRDAHRLIRWAGLAGRQHGLVEDLFSRFFERGEDIGDRDVLLDAGVSIGMNRDKLAELLTSDAEINVIKEEDANAREAGVVGVPALLAGQKFMVMGAQDPDYMLRFFVKAQAKLQAAVAASS